MRLIYKSLLAATTLLGLASNGYSLPSAEKYADIALLADPDKGGLDPTMQPIFPQDDEDPNIFYAPYDQVYIKDPVGSADERLKFGLTYDEAGGFLSMTVRAGYSPNRVKAIQTLRGEGKKVLPLMPISGGWTLSMSSKNTDLILGAFDQIDTVLPDTPVAMSVFIAPKAIQYIVSAYNTGASLGVNYRYNFRAVLTPFKMRASIQWTNFTAMIQNEFQMATASEAAVGGCLFGICATGKAALQTHNTVRKLLRVGIERSYVKITYLGGGGSASEEDRYNRMIDELTKVVLAKVFKPMESSWKPIDNGPVKAECKVSGVIGACFSASIAHIYNSEVTFENREYTYEIEAKGIVNLPAVVGNSFSYLCKDHPELFNHIRTGAQGCPVKWERDGKGIQTTAETGQQPVLPPKTGGTPPVT
ncbi:MAG: hypothetical protein M3Q07_12550, partial [Pseudobdellovibrionaceae bacterium]|nr:hypothetical protein [Pseudobdellovibrionaceae bacterium]